MRTAKATSTIIVICLMIAGLVFLQWHFPASARAEEEKEKKPERLIEMAAEYPSVVVPPGEDVDLDLIFHNGGRSHETVNVRITSVPEGWTAKLKTYKFQVNGVHVPADDDKRLTFKAEPDKDIKPATYEFRIEAETSDGQFNMAQTVQVTVKEEEEGEKEEGVKLTTSYPVLRGPSDATFEFSVEVKNELDKEAVFNLAAQGPEKWDINFKPAYEDKYVSSIRLKEDESKSVDVEVKPFLLAEADEYPITMRVSSGDAKAEAQLNVILTGTYKLDAGTATGLLSLSTRPGKAANVSLYVKNSGSATNHNITFTSFKPENWKVEFKPENLPALEPGKLEQIELIITPYEEALVGDYSVATSIQGEKASRDVEFRVTVRESAAWGWIGIGIIVVVILGLGGLFRWLGRR